MVWELENEDREPKTKECWDEGNGEGVMEIIGGHWLAMEETFWLKELKIKGLKGIVDQEC